MDRDPLLIAMIGNFEPTYSTENEYRHAWEAAGHQVLTFQEGDSTALDLLTHRFRMSGDARPDLVHWTRTASLAARVGDARLWEMLRMAGRHGVPVVGVHLDIWIGFEREREVATDPYFRGVDLLMTADGGNDDAWASYGVEHQWLLPAISERWLGVGTPRDEYRSKIAFTGSWQGHYHKEARHRHELVEFLQRTYGDDCAFYPKRGQHAIRGLELNDLYASVDVVVGDSAVLPGKGFYCSDRIPETLGRGGILVHPYVEGVYGHQGEGLPFWCGGAWGWEAGDWAGLEHIIEVARDSNYQRDDSRLRAVEHIRTAHTYTHRAREIIQALEDRGML